MPSQTSVVAYETRRSAHFSAVLEQELLINHGKQSDVLQILTRNLCEPENEETVEYSTRGSKSLSDRTVLGQNDLFKQQTFRTKHAECARKLTEITKKVKKSCHKLVSGSKGRQRTPLSNVGKTSGRARIKVEASKLVCNVAPSPSLEKRESAPKLRLCVLKHRLDVNSPVSTASQTIQHQECTVTSNELVRKKGVLLSGKFKPKNHKKVTFSLSDSQSQLGNDSEDDEMPDQRKASTNQIRSSSQSSCISDKLPIVTNEASEAAMEPRVTEQVYKLLRKGEWRLSKVGSQDDNKISATIGAQRLDTSEKIFRKTARGLQRVSVKTQEPCKETVAERKPRQERMNDRLSLPRVSISDVLKSWKVKQDDLQLLNLRIVDPNAETKIDFEELKNCRYLRF